MNNIFFLLLILLSSFCSCSSKNGYMEEYREFISDVQKEHMSYDNEMWKEADEKFSEFSEDEYDRYFDELTDDEIKELSKLNSIYLGLKISRDAREKLLK